MERFVDEVFINTDRKTIQIKSYKEDCCNKCIYYFKDCDFDLDVPACIHEDRFDHNDIYFTCLDSF